MMMMHRSPQRRTRRNRRKERWPRRALCHYSAGRVLPGHHESPGAVESLTRIGAAAQPFGSERGFLSSVGKQFVLAVPTLLVSLRSKRTSRVIDQLKVTLITWQRISFAAAQNINEHLI